MVFANTSFSLNINFALFLRIHTHIQWNMIVSTLSIPPNHPQHGPRTTSCPFVFYSPLSSIYMLPIWAWLWGIRRNMRNPPVTTLSAKNDSSPPETVHHQQLLRKGGLAPAAHPSLLTWPCVGTDSCGQVMRNMTVMPRRQTISQHPSLALTFFPPPLLRHSLSFGWGRTHFNNFQDRAINSMQISTKIGFFSYHTW